MYMEPSLNVQHLISLVLVLWVPTLHRGEARLSAAPQGSRRVAFGRLCLTISNIVSQNITIFATSFGSNPYFIKKNVK